MSYEFVNGSAVNGQDFLGTNNTLWFSVDGKTQYIPFKILDDSRHDPEQFSIRVTDQQTGMKRRATVNITDGDKDPPPGTKPKLDLDVDSDNNNGFDYEIPNGRRR